MNLALELYKEQIIVNEAFRDSLAEELVSNQIFQKVPYYLWQMKFCSIPVLILHMD